MLAVINRKFNLGWLRLPLYYFCLMNVSQMDAKNFFYKVSLVISFICIVLISIIYPFALGVDNEIEVFRPLKVYSVLAFYFFIYLGFHNSIGMRYLTPQNTFWILPYSKTWCIGCFLKCILKWKPTIFTILLFVAPEFFMPYSLKYKLIDIFVFLMLLFSFIALYAVLWHTRYDKKRIKDYSGLVMIPFVLLSVCNAIKFYFSLWYFFAGLIVSSLVVTIIFYIRRYKFCK